MVSCQVELEYHNALKEKVRCKETKVIEFKVCVYVGDNLFNG